MKAHELGERLLFDDIDQALMAVADSPRSFLTFALFFNLYRILTKIRKIDTKSPFTVSWLEI